jgi:hypothetical protein
MKIKSTMISNKSTDGSNHSTEGSDESISHMADQDAVMARRSPQGPPSESVGKSDGKEFAGEVKMPGITEIKGGGSVNSDANHEAMCKHPSKEYDPACRC